MAEHLKRTTKVIGSQSTCIIRICGISAKCKDKTINRTGRPKRDCTLLFGLHNFGTPQRGMRASKRLTFCRNWGSLSRKLRNWLSNVRNTSPPPSISQTTSSCCSQPFQNSSVDDIDFLDWNTKNKWKFGRKIEKCPAKKKKKTLTTSRCHRRSWSCCGWR